MSLYRETDLTILKNNIEKILEDVEDKKMTLIEPYGSEIRDITNIILKFIKTKKRKIYGGYALNLLIKNENKKDAIYGEKENPDIDFYSPEPLKDLIELCNIIYDKGYKFIRGYEAQHRETYSIRVNNHLYCDLSYVPKNVYNRMPFKEIDGMYVVHPLWYTIDFLRMMTDPLTSYWRIEKHFERYYLIQKYYPFPKIDKPIVLSLRKEIRDELRTLLDEVHGFLEDRGSTIAVGFYAYDHFLKESTIMKNNNNGKLRKFNYIEAPYYEIISTDFQQDCLSLISALKNTTYVTNNPDTLEVIEHYPYFQFLGHSAYIYYKDILIAIVYHYNKKCLPYLVVDSDTFYDNRYVKGKKKINIGTFSLTMMYALMTVMKARSDEDEKTKDLYMTFISHILEMRQYYFNKYNKNMLSSSVFRDFVLECKGYAVTPEKERALLIEQRKKKNQRVIYAYDPSENKKDSESNYVFANSSGNPVKNVKNLKLNKSVDEVDVVGTDDSDDPEDNDGDNSAGDGNNSEEKID